MSPAAVVPFFAIAETDSPMLLWLIVAGLMALGPVIHSYVRVYDWFKGRGVDTTSFVTRAEWQAAQVKHDAQLETMMESFKDDIKGIKDVVTDIARDLPAIHRALGRLEGHDEAETRPARRAR